MPAANQPADFNRAFFDEHGFVVIRGLVDAQAIARMLAEVTTALDPLTGPVEYESDVGYPGAPESRDASGGNTPRRLLHAYGRAEVFREWGAGPLAGDSLRMLMHASGTASGVNPGVGSDIAMSQCHHNCVMTKHPGHSSLTAWHQDIRYWSFDRPELVSSWLALGPETEHNGALQVIPGSHRLDLDRGRLDRDLFLRPELPENAALIEQAQCVEMQAGDVLFFHCRTLHAAGRNRSDEVKLSCVFTYHTSDNRPIPGTRSDLYPSIPVQ